MAPGLTQKLEERTVDIPSKDKPVKDSNGTPTPNLSSGKPTSKLSELDVVELKIADKYAAKDRFIGFNSHDWHPWTGGLEVKPIRYENRTGTFVIVVGNRNDKEAHLGRHRHRGPVTAVTLQGEWWYEEYNWKAKAKDYVVESPGTIHTLHLGPHTEVLFTVGGSLEFYNDDDSLRQTMDLFSFKQLYLDDCKKKGIPPDDSLWF